MKQITAILIDAENHDIAQVGITDDIQTYYKHLRCEIFTIAFPLFDGDIFVDDEGYLKSPTNFFRVINPTTGEAISAWFAGNGLLVGVDGEGEGVSTTASITQVKKCIRFASVTDPALAPKPGPPIIIGF